MTASSSTVVRRLGPDFPKAKQLTEIEEDERKRAEEAAAKGGKYLPQTGELPPVIRSVMELSTQLMSWFSQSFRSCPGGQGGLFYRGKPYCYAFGYRDSSRVMEMEETGNHLKAKDPLLANHLSIPILTALVCQLSDEGVLHFDTPFSQCIPELGPEFDIMTPRNVLSYQTVLNGPKILRDCGAPSRMIPFWLTRRNISQSFESQVYAPICKFFNVGASSASGCLMLSGQQQRENMVQYLVATRAAPLRVSLNRCFPCHFSLALLAACIDRRLKQCGVEALCFEDAMRDKLFIPLDSRAAGYGIPKPFRDPNEIFYRPTGISSGHHGFKTPIPVGAFANAAPPLFNGSLNLYAPCEEFCKLLIVSLDCIKGARKILGPLPGTAVPNFHYDFGVTVAAKSEILFSRHKLTRGLDGLPFSGSFLFDTKNDLAAFAVNNNGSRRARFFVNTQAKLTHYLFVQNVLSTGVDAEDARDPAKPEEPVNKAHEALEAEKKRNQKLDWNKNARAHVRF